jgi:hypothetical protein
LTCASRRRKAFAPDGELVLSSICINPFGPGRALTRSGLFLSPTGPTILFEKFKCRTRDAAVAVDEHEAEMISAGMQHLSYVRKAPQIAFNADHDDHRAERTWRFRKCGVTI